MPGVRWECLARWHSRRTSSTGLYLDDWANPAYEAPAVPIFAANWDENGMIKLQYKNSTLSAYPIIPGWTIKCDVHGIGLQGAGAPSAIAPCGFARLLNLQTGAHTEPRNERECKSDAASYTTGPLYVLLSY